MTEHLSEARRENYEFLRRNGVPLERIAERLDIQPRTLKRYVEQWEREDREREQDGEE